MVHSVTTKTYAERAGSQANPAAKRLLELMDRKQTNLCVSVDVTTTKEVLEIVKAIGPKVCMVKVSLEPLWEGKPDIRHTAISSRTLLSTLQRSSRSSVRRWTL
jgi:orotidine-5'-phosphate decarboxylase